MFSRRKFLTTSSLALAGTACATKGKEASAAQDDAGATAVGGALPPAIAALTSMKGTSTPISVDERKARLEKARRLMAEHKIDALLLCIGSIKAVYREIEGKIATRRRGDAATRRDGVMA